MAGGYGQEYGGPPARGGMAYEAVDSPLMTVKATQGAQLASTASNPRIRKGTPTCFKECSIGPSGHKLSHLVGVWDGYKFGIIFEIPS